MFRQIIDLSPYTDTIKEHYEGDSNLAKIIDYLENNYYFIIFLIIF
jgi:hypothetical protein